MSLNDIEREFFNKLREESNDAPQKPLSEMSINEFREANSVFQEYAGKPDDIDFVDRFINCEAGHQLKFRVYQYDNEIRPLIIFFPGNGFCLDLFHSNHVAVSKIAKRAESHAVLVDFRLAPEYPYPAAFNDAVESVSYIFNHLESFNADKEKVVVGGFSGGACLTAAVCNYFRDNTEITIFHQLLIDGSYDLSFSLNSFLEYDSQDYLCNKDAVKHVLSLYCADPIQLKEPNCSPYWNDSLENLPDTTICIGEYSGARSQGEEYKKKLIAAHNNVTEILFKGQTHNTIICREVLSGGEDPANTVANHLKIILTC